MRMSSCWHASAIDRVLTSDAQDLLAIDPKLVVERI